MTPLKLSLLRAVYDWAIESGFTPHIIVDTKHPGARVPAAYIENDKIVLNVHPRALEHFLLNEKMLSFSARFGDRRFDVECPLPAIRAVYARENGQGIAFPDSEESSSPSEPTDSAPTPRKAPVLKRIK